MIDDIKSSFLIDAFTESGHSNWSSKIVRSYGKISYEANGKHSLLHSISFTVL